MDNEHPCQQGESGTRRTFLRALTGALGAVAAAVLGLPLVGYFFGFRKPGEYWVDVGAVGDFPAGETRRLAFDNPYKQPWDGMTARSIVYARYQGKGSEEQGASDQFLVLSAHCAHLGCPVTWFQQSGLFMCPCHGGVYYASGERASGPPPRGMFHCVWRIENGRLMVRAPHYPTLQNTLVEQGRATV